MAEWEQNETLRAALRERLAQPIASGQEPVAWWDEDGVRLRYSDTVDVPRGTPLYFHPAPAQHPLRRDEVADLHEETEPLCSLYTFRDIVADIEAKHGIKEKP